MLKVFFHHPVAKIFSLVAAIFVWLHVTTELQYKYTLNIPIIITKVAPQQTIISNDKTISFAEIPKDADEDDWTSDYKLSQKATIRVQGPGKSLMKFLVGIETGNLSIDASKFSIGPKKIILNNNLVNLQNKNFQTLDIINPKTVNFYFDSLILKTLPVSSKIAIHTNENYQLDTIIFEPGSVQVIGPMTKLAGLTTITTIETTFSNIKDDQTKSIPLEIPDPSLSLKPSIIDMSFKTTNLDRKIISNVVVTIQNPPPNSRWKIDPRFINITFVGLKDTLDSLTINDVKAFVDLSLLKHGTVNIINPSITYPAGVECIEIQPELVTITRD